MQITFGSRRTSNRSFQETLKSTFYLLKHSFYLLKHSFTLIGRNTGIVRPTVYLAALSLLMTSLFFGALACFFSGSNIATGIIALVVLLVILVPLRFFIRYLNCTIGGVLKACVESVKAIYFTILYTTITHEDQIPEAYRDQLMGYLRMGAPDSAPTAGAMP